MPRFPTPWHSDAPQPISWLPGHALDLIRSPTPSLWSSLKSLVGEGVACSGHLERRGQTSDIPRRGLDLHPVLMSFRANKSAAVALLHLR